MTTERDIGQLTEAVNTLKAEVHLMRKEVSALTLNIAQIKGGWKAISGASALVGGLIGAGIIKIAPFLGVFPK